MTVLPDGPTGSTGRARRAHGACPLLPYLPTCRASCGVLASHAIAEPRMPERPFDQIERTYIQGTGTGTGLPWGARGGGVVLVVWILP